MKTIISILFCSLLFFVGCEKDNTTDPNNNSNNSGTEPTPGIFQTYSFNALIDDSQILNAEVNSFMDNSKNTHIAWIKDEGDQRSLMYSFFSANDQSFSNAQTVYSGATDENVIAPDIIVDDNGTTHIAFIIKRDVNAGTAEGNYAVMYASGTSNSWTYSQVSTNPTDPSTSNNTDLYNCYVNGRPKVFIQNNSINVGYQADANANTSYDKYYIIATKNGSSWSRNQAFNLDDLTGTFGTESGIAIAPIVSGAIHGGFIEISNYSIRYVSESSNWVETEIGNYAATFGNKHIQVTEDVVDDTYCYWFNKENDKFCQTILNGTNYLTVSEYTINNTPSGNFFPATVDYSLDQSVMFYNTSSGDGYIVKYDNSSNAYVEILLEDDKIGVPYGKKCLYSDNDYVSLVTASQTDGKIYLTTNNNM